MTSSDRDTSTAVDFLRRHRARLVARSEAPRPASERALSLTADLCTHGASMFRNHMAVDIDDPCTMKTTAQQLAHAARALAEDQPSLVSGADTLRAALSTLVDELLRLIERRTQRQGYHLPMAFERIPQPIFVVSHDFAIEPLNASARQALIATDLMTVDSSPPSGPRLCHRVLFRRDDVCDDCPLDDVIDHRRHRTCGGVGLSPWSAAQAIAFFEELNTVAPSWTLSPSSNRTPSPSSPPSLPPLSTPTDPPPSIDRSNALLSTQILNAMSGGIFVVDQDGIIIYKNRAAEHIFGEPLEGKRASELPVPMDLSMAESSRELRLDRPGADSITIGYRCLPCELFGRPGVLVGCQDITEIERRRAEQAQNARLNELGRMCTAVAHEIRNPLTGIKATIQALGDDAPEPYRDAAVTVDREVDRLSALLDDFLGFARLRPVRRQSTDWKELARRAWDALGRRAEQMELMFESGPISHIDVDPDQLKQVLINLFVNSGDALDWQGTVTVGVESAGPSEVRLSVSDDGPGIPESQRESVFSPFVSSKTMGSGLGLSICERVIAAHHGHIHLAPSESGATFHIHLPTPSDE